MSLELLKRITEEGAPDEYGSVKYKIGKTLALNFAKGFCKSLFSRKSETKINWFVTHNADLTDMWDACPDYQGQLRSMVGLAKSWKHHMRPHLTVDTIGNYLGDIIPDSKALMDNGGKEWLRTNVGRLLGRVRAVLWPEEASTIYKKIGYPEEKKLIRFLKSLGVYGHLKLDAKRFDSKVKLSEHLDPGVRGCGLLLERGGLNYYQGKFLEQCIREFHASWSSVVLNRDINNNILRMADVLFSGGETL